MKRRMFRIIASILSCFLLFSTATVQAETATIYPSAFQQELTEKYIDPERVFSTDLRWWLAAASNTDQTLLDEIQMMYDGGFRGVELCMQNPVGDAPNEVYAYGSDMWAHKWKLMMNKLLDLGMGVYLTSGTNWATSNVPGLDPDSQAAMQGVVMGSTVVKAGESIDALPLPGTMRDGANFIAAYAYQGKQNPDFVYPAPDPSMPWVQAVTVPSFSVDHATAQKLNPTQGSTVWEQNLSFTAPEGSDDYVVFAFWSQGTYHTSSPSTLPSYATNYFDVLGVEALKTFWEEHYLNDPELNQKILEGDVQLFMDSLEITPGENGITYWASDISEVFKARKGYEIEPYLFLFAGFAPGFQLAFNPYYPLEGPNGFIGDNDELTLLNKKILNDWFDVLTQLYIERMLLPLKTWLNGVGIKTRAQISYGRTIEITEPSVAVDYPEAENLNQNNQIDIFRLHTAGSKLQNKVLSTETDGFPSGMNYGFDDQLHFRNAYGQYAAGFQRIIWHIWSSGYGYGEGTAWPGANPGMPAFYRFGNRHVGSQNYDEFNAHLGRVQQLMQTGKSRTDIGFIHNNWAQGMRTGGGLTGSQNEDADIRRTNWQLAHMGVHYRSTELQDNGYTYDYLSPDLLTAEGVYFDESAKTIELAGYKALVIYQKWLDISGAKTILSFAQKGLPVVIIEGAAKYTPFNDGEDQTLENVMAELMALENVKVAKVKDPVDYSAAVAGGYDDEVYEKLQSLGVRPYAEFAQANHQLLTQTRQDDAGNQYLFVYNYCDNSFHDHSWREEVRTEMHGMTISTEIKMDGMFIPYAIDAFTGQVTELANYRYQNGQTVFPISLDYGNVSLFAFEAVQHEKTHVVQTNADLAYVDESGIVLRMKESGACTAELSDGVTISEDVTVPAPYDITNWNITVNSWAPNEATGDLKRTETIGEVTTVETKTSTVVTPIEFKLETLTTWDKIPEVGSNVSGTGHYEATFQWNAADATGAYIDFGDELVESMKVWINGKKVGGDISTNPTKTPKSVGIQIDDGKGNLLTPAGKEQYTGGISWTKPVADITDYLQDGENSIVIEYSSTLTNVALATGLTKEATNSGNMWGAHIAYRSYGPMQAKIVPFVEINMSPEAK